MTEVFPDRSEQLFGREVAVGYLVDRARRSGLTALTGRPLMGKTWILTETARRLSESGWLVGYHEFKGSETSHLLYVVCDLYARWLAQSDLLEQANSLWRRHKDSLVPRLGQMVGALLERISKSTELCPDGIATMVRSFFDGLVETQRDLVSGGIELAPLPYEQARSLTSLVATISGRNVVLVLDAWEKTPALRSEFLALESFLRGLDTWPATHVYLGVRHPQLASIADDRPLQCARDLCRISRSAEMYELAPMELECPKERERLIGFVRDRVETAMGLSDERLLALIAGYPGVLNFWTDETVRSQMRTPADLQQEAKNAQAIRYLDLDYLLERLPDNLSALAARLAFFPQLDARTWSAFRTALLGRGTEVDVDRLIDARVLHDERYPTYGHDTRHAAARSWYMTHKRPLLRRMAEQLIEALAVEVSGSNPASLPFLTALCACIGPAREVGLDGVWYCLLYAADLHSDRDEIVPYAGFEQRCDEAVRRNPKLTPIVSAAFNARGARKERRGDPDGALADFGVTRSMEPVPADQLAFALCRSAYVQVGRAGPRDLEDGIALCTKVLELQAVSTEYTALALNQRGTARLALGEREAALDDFTTAIGLTGIPTWLSALAHNNRGTIRTENGDLTGAIDDFSATLELADLKPEEKAAARFGRGRAKYHSGDREGAITDFTAVIRMPDPPALHLIKSYVSRGTIWMEGGFHRTAIADYTAVIKHPQAPASTVVQALADRGALKYLRFDYRGALEDCTDVIQRPDAPDEVVAIAALVRGLILRERGAYDPAMEDLSVASRLTNAPGEIVQVAQKYMKKTGQLTTPVIQHDERRFGQVIEDT